MDKVAFRYMLHKNEYYNRQPTKGRNSGRDRYLKNNLDNDVRRSSNLDAKLNGRGIEKIVIPSNIIDIYTRLEILLGLKSSGHTDTLSEAGILVNELYKIGETPKQTAISKCP